MTKHIGTMFPMLACIVALAGANALAQSPCPTQVLSTTAQMSPELICLVPQVFGPGGLVGVSNGGPLDDTTGHAVHFQASALRSFTPINAEIGVQLSQLPVAAPVAGFTFAGGVITTTTSFGPILTDRAETLGKGKIFLGLTYQYFNFDRADGINLQSFGAVFTHEPEPTVCSTQSPPPPCLGGEPLYTRDIIATQNRIDLKVHQVAFVTTYGVTDKLDVSLVVPILDVRMAMGSTAQIYSFEPPPLQHKFIGTPDPFSASFSNKAYSFGMGDLTIRVKDQAWQGERSAVALGADFRIPTGDANNFLGAGTWGFRPFVTYSARVGRISPHGTVGYQGNGQTVLAGDVTNNPVTKTHLPNLFNYSAGIDATLFRRLGLSGDYLGASLLHADKITPSVYTDYGGNTHANITTSANTINLSSVSVGFKLNPFKNLLVTANSLFRLNDTGLHSKPVPLFGLSYAF